MNPLVSIIIVNYNGFYLLKECIDSILKNKYSNYEIIIADNGSKDNSISQIKSNFQKNLSKIKILNLHKNLGPALARNKAFKISKGDIIAFLDNDTQVDKDWIKQALLLFQKNSKIGVIQSKLLLMNQKNKIDYVGEYLGNLGFLKSIADYGEVDNGQYNYIKSILAAKSAGMFIRRQAFIDAGMFDPDYFIFMEETDLGWRTWLLGYQNILAAKSIVYHKFSSTKDIVDPNFNNFLIRFHGTKNYIQTLIKNLDTKNLIKILPKNIILWLGLAFFLIITGKIKSGYNILKGIVWNFKNFHQIFKKRQRIQNNRIVTDDKLFNYYHLMIYTSISLYIKKFLNSQKNNFTPENQ